MSDSLLSALLLSDDEPLESLPRSTVFCPFPCELRDTIFAHMPLQTLVHLLCTDKALQAAARSRLDLLLPTLRPLLAPPFALQPSDLLEGYGLSFMRRQLGNEAMHVPA